MATAAEPEVRPAQAAQRPCRPARPRTRGEGLSPPPPHPQSPSHAVSGFILQVSLSFELKSECVPGTRMPQHL